MIQYSLNQPDRIIGERVGRSLTKDISSRWPILCIPSKSPDYQLEKEKQTKLIRRIWLFWLHKITAIVSWRRKRWQKEKPWLDITGNFVSQPQTTCVMTAICKNIEELMMNLFPSL